MSQHLFFQVAGTRFALPSKHVKAVHAKLSLKSVAGTCNWFLGLAVCEGRLIPVTDLGLFAGSQPSEGSAVELHPAVALAAFKVDSVSGVAAGNEKQVNPSNTTVAPHGTKAVNTNTLREFVTGELVSDRGASHHVLDVLTLVQSDRFINIRESNKS